MLIFTPVNQKKNDGGYPAAAFGFTGMDELSELHPVFIRQEEDVVLVRRYPGMTFGAKLHVHAFAFGHAGDFAVGHDHRVTPIPGPFVESLAHLFHDEQGA